MPFVDEKSRYGTWPGVHIFVITPACEIHLPVMQMEINITSCVSEIPSNQDTFRLGVSGNSLDVEVLTSVILYAWEKDESGG